MWLRPKGPPDPGTVHSNPRWFQIDVIEDLDWCWKGWPVGSKRQSSIHVWPKFAWEGQDNDEAFELVQLSEMVGIWAQIVRQCQACGAREFSTRPVPGEGRVSKSGILIIGHQTGTAEDVQGHPYIGQGGDDLNEFLSRCGLARNEVFVTNVVLCHTLDRKPQLPWVKTCAKTHLLPLLKMLQPRLVLTMGAQAAQWIFEIKLSDKHGLVMSHPMGFDLIPCYQPAAIRHEPGAKVQLDYDVAQIRRWLADESAERVSAIANDGATGPSLHP